MIESRASSALVGGVVGSCVGLLAGSAEAGFLALKSESLRELGLLWWVPLVTTTIAGLFGLGLGFLAGRFGAASRVSVGRLRRLVVASWMMSALLLAFAALASTPRPPRDFTGVRLIETQSLAERNPSPGPEARARPDIFLIVADTLRADFVSSYDPDSPARTPAIDSLARDGIRFDRACAQSAWTKPTFASLMSGLHPPSHTATDDTAILPEDIETLAEVLRDAGYYTLGTSNKNPNNSSRMNFDQGYSEYIDFEPSTGWWGAPWSATTSLVYEQFVAPWMQRARGHHVEHFYEPGEAITAFALGWLRAWERPANVPLFLSLHYMDPHEPYLGGETVSQQQRRIWRVRDTDPPPVEMIREAYAGDVERMDAALGELFAGLRALGLYDDALIVFTADHGEEFHEHGGWVHSRTLYTEQLHVPLIVKLPGQAAAGTVADPLVSQVDVAPTLLSLVGAAVPGRMQGRAVLGETGRPLASEAARCVSALTRRGNHIESIRSREAALLASHPMGDEASTRSEFYDLARDPLQQADRSGQGDPREARLREALRARIAAMQGAQAESGETEMQADQEAQLRALGYIE